MHDCVHLAERHEYTCLVVTARTPWSHDTNTATLLVRLMQILSVHIFTYQAVNQILLHDQNHPQHKHTMRLTLGTDRQTSRAKQRMPAHGECECPEVRCHGHEQLTTACLHFTQNAPHRRRLWCVHTYTPEPQYCSLAFSAIVHHLWSNPYQKPIAVREQDACSRGLGGAPSTSAT